MEMRWKGDSWKVFLISNTTSWVHWSSYPMLRSRTSCCMPPARVCEKDLKINQPPLLPTAQIQVIRWQKYCPVILWRACWKIGRIEKYDQDCWCRGDWSEKATELTTTIDVGVTPNGVPYTWWDGLAWRFHFSPSLSLQVQLLDAGTGCCLQIIWDTKSTVSY